MDTANFVDDVSVDLLQQRVVEDEEIDQSMTAPKGKPEPKGEQKKVKCRKKCHYHPKQECRLICRETCTYVSTECPSEPTTTITTTTTTTTTNGEPTTTTNGEPTTTTTTSKEFSKEDPPTANQTCDLASTLKTTFDKIEVNTLGQDVENPRLVYKDVVELSRMLSDKIEWANRKFDLTITDASQKPRYTENPEENIVTALHDGKGFQKYKADSRGLTGSYRGTIRIGIDEPGSYVFRLTLTDSETGELASLPLFPLTFYDVDGTGEIVSTCDAARVISVNSKLEEKEGHGCFVHHAQGREVNLPRDFEDLTWPQKSQSVTYVYANKAEFDIQLHLEEQDPRRYFIMKSSNVLACTNDIKTQNGSMHKWKNTGQPKEADA
jgi:hypothetical protein